MRSSLVDPRIQTHSSRTSGLPFTSSVCDMDAVAAPPCSHSAGNPLTISSKVDALIPKECDSVHVKSSRWQCLPSFQKVW